MNIQDYISSGILELYVLGQLSPEETKEVELMQAAHIEIQREIHEISMGLEKYGQINAIKTPEAVADKLFNNLPPKQPVLKQPEGNHVTKSSGSGFSFITILFAIASIIGLIMYFIQQSNHKDEVEQYNKIIAACDSIQQASQIQFALLEQINNPNNQIIDMTPTAAFAGISVYLHYNPTDQRNFLQLINLPDITPQQSFQLWSLKPGQDPIPLDVFADRNKIIEVAFENNTATYAITIEPAGGSKTPTLDKLIGTMGVI